MSTGTLRRHREVIAASPKPDTQPTKEPVKPVRAALVDDRKRPNKKLE